MTTLDALPSVPASALPADVRAGSAADQKAYRAALGFERVLLQTLVEDMTKSSGLEDSPHAGAIQDSLADSLIAGGGMGMGEQLYHALRPENLRADAKPATEREDAEPATRVGATGGASSFVRPDFAGARRLDDVT